MDNLKTPLSVPTQTLSQQSIATLPTMTVEHIQKVLPSLPTVLTQQTDLAIPSRQTEISGQGDNYTDDNSCCCTVSCLNKTFNRMFCKLYKDRDNVESMLDNIDLPYVQKQHIKSRYINILENFKKRSRRYSIVFHLGHFVITVGSLFVPALLSIQNASSSITIDGGHTIPIYIITFIVSLLVTIFNGILTLFKIDKKYYFLNTTMEKLRSEGWQYLGLTGRYSGRSSDAPSTHENQFIVFSHQIEKIKMKQVEEEFYKSDETSLTQDVRSSGVKQPDLYPLSPALPINGMTDKAPAQIKDIYQSMIKSQSIIPTAPDAPISLPDSSGHSEPSGPSDAVSITIAPKNTVVVPDPKTYRDAVVYDVSQ